MHNRIAAHTVATLHFGFIAFAFLGGLLLWVWPGVIWLHLPVFLCAPAKYHPAHDTTHSPPWHR